MISRDEMRVVLQNPDDPKYLLTFNPETIAVMLDQIEDLERKEATARHRRERERGQYVELLKRTFKMRRGMGLIGDALREQGLTEQAHAVYDLLKQTTEGAS